MSGYTLVALEAFVRRPNNFVDRIEQTLEAKLLSGFVKSCQALALICLIAIVDANTHVPEKVSTVSAGDIARTAEDTVAILGEFAGKPSIDLYLFAKQLTPAQRLRFAIHGSITHDSEPIRPIGHLMFFFREGARRCDEELISYTAVFERSKDFAIPVLTNSPINWAYSGTSFRKYGVRELNCRLAHGAPFKAKIQHSHELNESNEHTFFNRKVLPGNVDRLVFRWNLVAETTLIDRNLAFQHSETANSTVNLSTEQIADSDAIYISQYQAFVIRFYGAKVDPANRGHRASADDASLIGHVFLTTKGSDNGLPVVNCTISINQQIGDGVRRAHDAPCNGGTNMVSLSGGYEVGTPIGLKMTGAAPADVRLKRPKLTWSFEIQTTLERVFQQ